MERSVIIIIIIIVVLMLVLMIELVQNRSEL